MPWHSEAMFDRKIHSNHVIITIFDNYLTSESSLPTAREGPEMALPMSIPQDGITTRGSNQGDGVKIAATANALTQPPLSAIEINACLNCPW